MTSTATPETSTVDLAFDQDMASKPLPQVLRSHPGAGYTAGELNADRYVITDNGDGTYSLRDTVGHRWVEQGCREDMSWLDANDLREEYRWS